MAKLPKSKPTPKKKSKPRSTPSGDVATVRMFCQGLGDCFLITFPQKGPRPYCVLIDCGVAMGTKSVEKIMPEIVAEIARLTGGVIDLLVVTHEHWDHVSGFVQAAAEMSAKLKFK